MSQLYSVGDRVVFSAIGCRAWGTQVLPMYNDIRSQNFVGLCEGVVSGLIDYTGQTNAGAADSPLTGASVSIATTTTDGRPVITEYVTSYTTGQYRNRMIRMLGMVENEEQRRLLAYYAIPRIVARSAYISMLRDLGRAIRGEDAVDFPLVDVEEIVAAAQALNLPVLRAPEKRGFTALMVEEPDLEAAFSSAPTSRPVSADPSVDDTYRRMGELAQNLQQVARPGSGRVEIQSTPMVSRTGGTWLNPVDYAGSSSAPETQEPPQANVGYPVDPEPEDDDYAESDDRYDDDADEEAA